MMFPILQEEKNMYMSYLSSSSEGSSVRLDGSYTSSRSTRFISTRFQKVRRKFHKHMDFFLVEGGSCSYEHETIGNIKVPLRYKHIVKQWVPKDLPQINTYFCMNEMIYRIEPSSLHGLGLFCMDGMMVDYERCI